MSFQYLCLIATSFAVLSTSLLPNALAAINDTPKPISIQIGSYSTIRKAALVRSILKNLASVRVQSVITEDKKKMYRVLLGSFDDVEHAEDFIGDNNLKKLFPDSWVNAVSIPERLDGEVLVEAEIDPYVLNFDLYCKDKKSGVFTGEFKPEPGLEGGAVDYKVTWNCSEDAPPRPGDLDKMRRPSHLAVVPFFGSNSFTAKPSGGAEVERSGVVYGVELGAFKNFGGVGTFIHYRLAHHGYGLLPDSPKPTLAYEHRVTAGATLHVRNRLEAEPVFGYMRHHYYDGSDTFEYLFLPFAGLRGRYGLLRLNDRAELDLGFGIHHLMAKTGTTGPSAASGLMWTAEIRTRHFTEKKHGVAWFMEYTSISQSTSIGTQSSSNFLLGVSVYFL